MARSTSRSKSSRQVVPRSAVQTGALTRYGYALGDSKTKRQAALRKACREEKCKHPPCTSHNSGVHRVIKQVNLLVVWNKSRPALERKAKADLRYVQSLLHKTKRSRSKPRRSRSRQR